MHLKILINKTIDGYSAVVPTIKGCESWSDNPDQALEKIIELLSYYLKKESDFKYKLDCTKKSANQEIYTIVI